MNFIRLGATAAPVQPALRSQSHLPEIDGLRGIACLLVVLLHCLLGFVIFPALTPARNVIGMFLAGGVDTFFVLSGFLIVGILIDNRGASNYFRVFWARRVLRIFPVYFLLYATFLIMLGVKSATNAPALNVWLFKDSLPVWSYPLFIQNYFMAVEQQTGSYWVGITWSLAIEEQFYLIMPLLAFVLRRSQVFFLALVCVAIAFFLRVASGNDWWNYFGTPFRMDSLMFGAAVACVVRDERILKFCRRWRAVLDVAIIFLAMLALQTPLLKLERLYCFSIMSAVTAYIILRIHLVDGGWVRSVLRAQVLVQLGAISYPLYMYHQAVNGLVHGIWFGKEPAILEFRQLMAAVLVMTISIVLAALSTRYFERPFRQKGKTLKYSFEPAIGASAIQVEAPLLEARAG